MSSSSSFSSEAKWPFDVFLSFRGEDVRHGFLADLHRCLLHDGINAYIDSEDLRRGDEISPALMRAIEESRIAVLVFSEDYASSRWCLDELVKVMECRRLNGQQVLPVFYRVEPREVRGQRESYGKALARHEEKLGKGSERVEKWRQALIEAANLSGWHYDHGDETEFIEKIVKEISATVARVPLSVAKYPVGVGCRVEKVMSLLSMGSDDVQMIGIWGTRGLGKTTIAKDVYNSIASQFDGCSFLANVRETSNRPDGLVHLQKALLSETLWKENLVVLSEDKGANLIRDRLCCRKILLVLDDVDHGDQLNALARECAWFGKGSRIIITTRDKHVLTSHGIDWVYEVKPLDQDEASELLSSYAFSRNQTKDISMDLIDNILGYANGLPLAIVVLGPFLRGRSRGEWESTLETLTESPNKDINRVLKISFDALDNNQKDIFLDIACFFKRRKRDYVTRVLDGCGLKTLIGMQTLIERSLVTIEDDSTIQMHDLIEQMGQDIVKNECLDDPGRRSRLWCYDDVFEILSEDMGTNAVKGIVLDLPTRKKLDISPSAFTHMRRLKLLIILNAQISGGPICLPNDLRWLEWPGCPLSTPVYVPKKLVCFHVPDSQIKEFGRNLKDFRMLKDINFSKCNFLTRVPDISWAPNLERLDLSWCESLVEVDQSVGYLDKLEFLSLDACSNLSIFPSILKTKSLRELGLSDCSKLEKFFDIPEKIEHLKGLELAGTAIKDLPASINNLVSVEYISLWNCKNFARLPSSIYKLQNLSSMDIRNCSNFITFPKNLEDPTDLDGGLGFPNLDRLNLQGCNLSGLDFLEGSSNFPKLTYLNLGGNKFTHMPRCFRKYDNLTNLYLDNCKQLQEIPQLPSNIGHISANNCRFLQKLPDFSSLSNFSEVDFSSCCGLSRKGFDLAGVSILKYLRKTGKLDILLIGGEMPGWIHHCEEGPISFKVPKDLYDKFLGLALCVVLGLEEGKVVDVSCEVQIFVNGKRVLHMSRAFYSLESDHVWLEYFQRMALWEVEKYLQNDWSHFQVHLRVCTGSIKKCGFRLICQQQEDDLRVEPQCPHPIEINWMVKESDSEEDNSIDTKEEDSPIETDGEES
ncbi:disease resistance protein RPV1 isoform X1 [Eucalyptus grandis]|uniref:disease resistance protein RPV1 isoform X1 n=1 Tax=Eucalyptus grandis TaxID=71139 RepID=UPI00192EF223|nr:disease resistance protein RPV1 isoform X1 [Eucalyptus grandis]